MLERCHAKGVPAALVYASGYAETTDAEGKAKQAELAEFVRRSGMKVAGPNCMGNANFTDAIFTTFGQSFQPGEAAGDTALLTQSGNMSSTIFRMAKRAGVRFSHVINTGNEAGVEFSDYLEFLAGDAATRSAICYIEQLRDGPRFLAAAAKFRAAGKLLAVYKVGASEKGAEATRSHTAALAGDEAAYTAAFARAGVARAGEFAGLADLAYLHTLGEKIGGANCAILSISGAAGAILSDALALAGGDVPTLPAGCAGGPLRPNPRPLDGFEPGRSHRQHGQFERFPVGVHPPGAFAGHYRLAAALHARLFPRERARSGRAGRRARATRRSSSSIRSRSPTASGSRPAGSAISRISTVLRGRSAPMVGGNGQVRLQPRSPWPRPAGPPSIPQPPRSLKPRPSKPWRPLACRWSKMPWFSPKRKRAVPPNRIGYPLVAKLVSPEVAHKTEHGLIRLGLNDADAVADAFAAMMAKAKTMGVRIDGVTLEPMLAGGVEILAGVTRDPVFGWLLTVGLGGVWTELMKDVRHALLPVDAAEAEAMLRGLKGFKLLDGYRGAPKADVAAAARAIAALGQAVLAGGGRLREVEINPLLVLPEGKGAVAVDALVLLTAD